MLYEVKEILYSLDDDGIMERLRNFSSTMYDDEKELLRAFAEEFNQNLKNEKVTSEEVCSTGHCTLFYV